MKSFCNLSFILLYFWVDNLLTLHAFTLFHQTNYRTPSSNSINSNNRIRNNNDDDHNNNNSNRHHNNIIKQKPSYLTKLHSTRKSPSRENGVTSTLISNLAVIALKLRLSSQTSVQCTVNSSSKDIFFNQSIGPVSVKGRDWSSPLGLTCKAIQADVETCMLDMNSVVTKRKLILLEPAKGVALIAFNNVDFGNFLIHPLLLKQAPKCENGEKFEFLKDDVEIMKMEGEVGGQEEEEEEKCVVFYGKCNGQRWKCILKRGLETSGGGRLASIEVIHDGPIAETAILEPGEIQSLETEMTMIVTSFFNELVFELDGTFLSYKDLKFHTPKKAKTPSETNIMFALDIMVKKFPSPGLAF